jgi:hypothetical protein
MRGGSPGDHGMRPPPLPLPLLLAPFEQRGLQTLLCKSIPPSRRVSLPLYYPRLPPPYPRLPPALPPPPPTNPPPRQVQRREADEDDGPPTPGRDARDEAVQRPVREERGGDDEHRGD